MSSVVCKSGNCIQKATVVSQPRPMRQNFETAEIRCFSNPPNYQGNCVRMPSREFPMQKGSGFESKGLILLLVCGIYAVFLFIAARLLSYIASTVAAPVKSVMWRVETKEMSVIKLTDDNNNSALKTRLDRQRPRTISHG